MMQDKRITYVALFGKEYPMCLTVAAEQQLIERFGGLEQVANQMTDGEAGIPVVAEFAHIMMEGGQKRVKALAWLEGEEAQPLPVPPMEVLLDALDLADAQYLSGKLLEAVCVSRGVTVEVAEEREEGKNGETTQG